MAEKYWNKCRLIEVRSNIHCPGFEEWLFVETKDGLKFEIFASGCRKFSKSQYQKFDFGQFKPETYWDIKISGHLYCVGANNLRNPNNGAREGAELTKKCSPGRYLVNNVNTRKLCDVTRLFVLGEVIKKSPPDYEGERGRLMKAKNLHVYFIDNDNETEEGDTVLLSIYGITDIRPGNP